MAAKTAAELSKEYRQRKKAKAAALGVKHLSVEVAAGVEQRLIELMQAHGFEQFEELFQTLALNVLDAPPDLVAQMLKRPSASEFQIKPKHARQLREFAETGEPDDGHE
jgi:HPt (histidine-containing phosphotransfer) domain-containing protein